jgi:antitoxin component YwqK of YwqJK toxin-antitoxin module
MGMDCKRGLLGKWLVMTKRLYCFVLVLLAFTNGLAQQAIEGDTVYFSKKWELTEKRGHAIYRIAAFEDSLYVIKDYYAKGGMQFQGKWLLKDTSETSIRFSGNLPDHKAIGYAWWYYKNGNPSTRVEYLYLAQPCDTTKDYHTEHIAYFKNGGQSSTWHELNRKDHGMLYWYDESTRKVSETQEMANGLANGKLIHYYTDESIHEITYYVDGKKHGTSTTYYDYPTLPKWKKEYENGKLIRKKKFTNKR